MSTIDKIISWIEGEITNSERIKSNYEKEVKEGYPVSQAQISYWQGRIDALDSVISHCRKIQ